MQIWEPLFSLLFPAQRNCQVCGLQAGRASVCPRCRLRITDKSGFTSCRVCGRFSTAPAGDKGEGRLCGECRIQLPVFSSARAVGLYRDELKDAIYKFKYGGLRSLADFFGPLLAEVFLGETDWTQTGILVPVPLAVEKIGQRGYNQSELLACRLGGLLGLPVGHCLNRVKHTPSQSKLTGRLRREMVSGVFALNEAPGPVQAVLVDDILTTGATAAECARILLQAGAKSVAVLTLASGLQEKFDSHP